MSWSDFAKVFLLGLAGSGHCIGMCGAFAMAVSVGARNRGELLARHVCYQLGKSASYAFVGVLLLLAAEWVAQQAPVLQFQRLIGIVAGVAMVVVGVLLLFEVRLTGSAQRVWFGAGACNALSSLWRSPSLFKSVLVGWVNGFLPCGLSFMALLYLASTGSTTTTVIGAFVFGAATLPSLLLVGWVGQKLGVQPRRWLVRVSGALLIALGVLTTVRDQPAVHGWFHKHLMPSVQAVPAGETCHQP
ncbi:sulfite exporter TauE/SafE family protein [Opitutaceae bacterium EW11]|nr:sulfite exporter TauE/SafE family protein [Opitutaceae bacterium EW11]